MRPVKVFRALGFVLCAACARSPEPEAPAPVATTRTEESAELTIAEPDAGPAAEPVDPMAPLPPREDAGPFDFDAAPVDDTTEIQALGAVVRKKAAKGREIVLLSAPPSAALCSVRSGDPEFIMTLSCDWSTKSSCASLSVRIEQGRMVRRSVRAKVTDAPTAKGQTGRLELEKNDQTNIHGSDVPALVCD